MRKVSRIKTPAADKADFIANYMPSYMTAEDIELCRFEFGRTDGYQRVWFRDGGIHFSAVEKKEVEAKTVW